MSSNSGCIAHLFSTSDFPAEKWSYLMGDYDSALIQKIKEPRTFIKPTWLFMFMLSGIMCSLRSSLIDLISNLLLEGFLVGMLKDTYF